MQADCLTFEPLYMERIWGGRKLQTCFDRPSQAEIRLGNPGNWSIAKMHKASFPRPNFAELPCTKSGLTIGRKFSARVRLRAFSDSYQDSGRVRYPFAPSSSGLTGNNQYSGRTENRVLVFCQRRGRRRYLCRLKNGVSRSRIRIGPWRRSNILNFCIEVPTQPDTYIFIPGGRLHAIGAGNVLFEIQQNSDTTYRVFDWNRLGLNGQPQRAPHCRVA